MMCTQHTLPAEIIFQILCFMSPRDVVRSRTVSKQFRDISYLPIMWRTLYANARFPRPPGPFPSQSIQFLQRTLVKSERLEQSWTTQPMRDVSSVEVRLGIRLQGSSLYPFKLVHGQWLVGCELSRKFVIYDIDSEEGVPRSGQVLWEPDERIRTWDASAVMSIDGPVVCIIFDVTTPENSFSPWKFLGFRVDSTSGHLNSSFSLDIPTKNEGKYPLLNGGYGPFLDIRSQNLTFHVETRQFFKIPPFDPVLRNFSPEWTHLGRLTSSLIRFTKTHLIVFYSTIHDSSVRQTLVRALTLPPESCTIPGHLDLLRVSHEGIVNGSFQNPTIIRNSVVDSISGEINIRILDQSCKQGSGVCLSCFDLTLHTSTPNGANTVLPMTIDIQDVLKVSDIPSACRSDGVYHVESSDDGYARGFLRFYQGSAVPKPPSSYQVMRFAIDASRERCIGVIGELAHPQWKGFDHPLPTFSVDCMRGRLCYLNRGITDLDKHPENVFVVNIE